MGITKQTILVTVSKETGKMAKCRNSPLDGGISRLSRSAVYRKRALYKRKKAGTVKAAKATAETTKVKPIGGDKNGQERVVPLQKASRFYPTEDVKKPLRHRQTPRPTKLRKSLTPGTIVILLAGRHKGKRVVFLKDLRESGLILVTGPYQVNGVPLRRVPQSYVIATQTKVDVSGVDSDKLDADTFKRQKKAKGTSDNMFEESADGYTPSEERKALQQTVDEAIIGEISKEPHLRKYMQQLFTLRKNQFPHEMVF